MAVANRLARSLALFSAAIVGTYARGPWVGLAAAVAVMFLAHPVIPTARAETAKWAGLVALLVVLAGGMLFVQREAGSQMRTRLYNTLAAPFSDASVVERLMYFRDAAAIVRDYPVAGVGFESFPLVLPKSPPPRLAGPKVTRGPRRWCTTATCTRR